MSNDFQAFVQCARCTRLLMFSWFYSDGIDICVFTYLFERRMEATAVPRLLSQQDISNQNTKHKIPKIKIRKEALSVWVEASWMAPSTLFLALVTCNKNVQRR